MRRLGLVLICFASLVGCTYGGDTSDRMWECNAERGCAIWVKRGGEWRECREGVPLGLVKKVDCESARHQVSGAGRLAG